MDSKKIYMFDYGSFYNSVDLHSGCFNCGDQKHYRYDTGDSEWATTPHAANNCIFPENYFHNVSNYKGKAGEQNQINYPSKNKGKQSYWFVYFKQLYK